MLIGVVGGVPLFIAYFVWVLPFFSWSPTIDPHLRLTVGRCAPFLRSIHPDDCAYIDRHPSIVLSGPGRLFGGSSKVRRVEADAQRKIDVGMRLGWYDIAIGLSNRRSVETTLPDSELFILWVDQHHDTVGPAAEWRPDSHRG
jgi:hypothetical protein